MERQDRCRAKTSAHVPTLGQPDAGERAAVLSAARPHDRHLLLTLFLPASFRVKLQ